MIFTTYEQLATRTNASQYSTVTYKCFAVAVLLHWYKAQEDSGPKDKTEDAPGQDLEHSAEDEDETDYEAIKDENFSD